MNVLKFSAMCAALVSAFLGFAATAAASPCCVGDPVHPGVTKTIQSTVPAYSACFCSDLGYGADSKQRLDIYKPAGAVPPGGHPTIVWVHGGGFQGSLVVGGVGAATRRFDRDVAPNGVSNEEDWAAVLRQVSRGYAVVAIDYRDAGPNVHFTEMRHDVQQAIRWVKWQASAYGLAPGRVGTWGHSAGATLVTLAAGYRAQYPNEPAWSFGAGYSALANYTDTSSLIIAYSGIYDFRVPLVVLDWPPGTGAAQAQWDRYSHFVKCTFPGSSSAVTYPTCSAALEKPDLPDSPSSVSYVYGPPALLAYGADDGLVPPFPQSLQFYSVRSAAGQSVDYFGIPSGASHGGPPDAPAPPNTGIGWPKWSNGTGVSKDGLTRYFRDYLDFVLAYYVGA